MTAPMLDMTRLQSMLGGLTPGARSQVLKEAGAIQSAFAPRRITLKEGEKVLEEGPEGLRQIAGIPKVEKQTSDIQEYNKAVEQGFKGSFIDYQVALRKAGATNVQVSTEGKEFGKQAEKFAAEGFRDLANQGQNATRTAIQLDRLDALLKRTGSGLATQAKAVAGNFGIETKGLSDIQAVEAIVNQLVPQQRPPGSGTMSDADLALFKKSLPRLINTPGGNQTIIDTLKAINQYDQQIGAIAREALRGRISQEEADARISRVQNPLRRTLDDIFGGGR
jgi:flagellar protein FlgJ